MAALCASFVSSLGLHVYMCNAYLLLFLLQTFVLTVCNAVCVRACVCVDNTIYCSS